MCQQYFVPHVSLQQDGSPTIDSCLMLRACTSRLGVIADLLMWRRENTYRRLGFVDKMKSIKNGTP